MSAAIEQLADRAEAAFAFLRERGLLLQERRILFPESFKGGFVLTFAGSGKEITIEYLDMQFEVRVDGVELFGSNTHREFAGNMFSRAHLLEHLAQLASVLRTQLTSPA